MSPVVQPLGRAGGWRGARRSGRRAGAAWQGGGSTPAGGKAEEMIADGLLIRNLVLLWVWLMVLPFLLELLFDG